MLTYLTLSQHPHVFQAMTGLRVGEFDQLLRDIEPRYQEAEHQRRQRPNRLRAPGGGPHHKLSIRDQLLLTVIWLRLYPTYETLGFLFGVSDTIAGRVIQRLLPLLEASGRDTMRLPDPGKKHRRELQQLLAELPELYVLVDTFEQRVQRPRQRTEADGYYSGKQKMHTLKSQVVVDGRTRQIVDVAASVRGPTADITLLKASKLLERLPAGVGLCGDLAYVGLSQLHPQGLGITPRRKPRGQPRPAEDVAFNRQVGRLRVPAEHSINRMRRYQALTQMDRHHRRGHTMRTIAVAGLVNRQLQARRPYGACHMTCGLACVRTIN